MPEASRVVGAQVHDHVLMLFAKDGAGAVLPGVILLGGFNHQVVRVETIPHVAEMRDMHARGRVRAGLCYGGHDV